VLLLQKESGMMHGTLDPRTPASSRRI